jgi:hypothetical protein
VAEVEVGLGAVFGHVDLAVLVGTHRPGVHVQVGIALLERDAQATAFQQTRDGGCCETFAEGGDNAAGNKNKFRRGALDCQRTVLRPCAEE